MRETLIYIAIESMAYSMNKHKKATAPKTLSIALYVIFICFTYKYVLFGYLNATSINDPAAVTTTIVTTRKNIEQKKKLTKKAFPA